MQRHSVAASGRAKVRVIPEGASPRIGARHRIPERGPGDRRRAVRRSAPTAARLRRIEGAADGRLRLAVQLLKPATALPFLTPGAATRVLIDGGPAGAGEVVGPAPANGG